MVRALVLLAGLGLVPAQAAVAPRPVVLTAADGLAIYASDYETRAPAAPGTPVILLFHQAGSSKSEYAPIAPRLVQLDYDALAVDLRSGGDMYDPPNETTAHAGRSASDYRAALPDMAAALAWARATHPHAPVYLWGSSYSAALVFALAASRPRDVAAVIAFSPNEYVAGDARFVRDAARRVTCPVFVDTAASAAEERGARAIVDALASREKVQYVPAHGIQGSSTLREDRDPSGAAENWDAVTRFLAHVTATQRP